MKIGSRTHRGDAEYREDKEDREDREDKEDREDRGHKGHRGESLKNLSNSRVWSHDGDTMNEHLKNTLCYCYFLHYCNCPTILQ